MKKLIVTLGTYLTLFTIALEKANAAANCYGSIALNATPKPLGESMICVLENVWGFMSKIFVAIAIILAMLLVYKTVTNRENEKELAELPQKWMYLIIFILLAFGAGGTVLDFTLRLFGFGGIDTWIQPLNGIFTSIDKLAKP